jgi:hypothetical protein
MPAFSTPEAQLLTNHEIEMLVRWLRQDDRDLKAKLQHRQKAQAASSP